MALPEVSKNEQVISGVWYLKHVLQINVSDNHKDNANESYFMSIKSALYVIKFVNYVTGQHTVTQ